MSRLRIHAALAASLAALAAGAIAGVADGSRDPAPPAARASQASTDLSQNERELIQLVSDYRQRLGLSSLRVYPTLMDEARWYAVDMARNDNFTVTHIDSLGRTIDQRFWDFGYPIVRPLGQATASGGRSPAETFEQLRGSRLHDEIMRDPRFRLVGSGHASNPDTDSREFWVISFARDDPRATRGRAAKARAAKARATKARAARSRG